MKRLSRSWQDLSDGQWQEACRRERVIRPLAEQDAVSRQAAAAAAEQLSIGPALVYRLVARFRARLQTSSLAPGVRGRGFRSCALDSGVEALVASTIKEVYLRPERPRLMDLWRAVRARGLELDQMEFRRFLHAIVLLPAQIVRSGRRTIYRIMGYNSYLKNFFAVWEKLRRMAPG